MYGHNGYLWLDHGSHLSHMQARLAGAAHWDATCAPGTAAAAEAVDLGIISVRTALFCWAKVARPMVPRPTA